jgi:hypothetical protein
MSSEDQKSTAKKLLNLIAAVTAFLVFYFVVQYAKQDWQTKSAVEKAEVTLEKLKEDAIKKRPDIHPVEAFREEAIEKVSSNLASKTGDAKLNAAADTYWGFYFINTRSRSDFCNSHGVDISNFSKVFAEMHKNETLKAKLIYSKLSKISEEQLYEKLKPLFLKTVTEDMQAIATQQKISLSQACQVFDEYAKEVVPEMLLSKTQPALSNALMAAK